MLTKPSKYSKKAQSAMEYLMTYGWAILIIAVVLGALFSLGVFSGSGILGTACVAGSGYLCQSPVFSHSTGVILVNIGQSTGTSWTAANFMFVPQGQAVSSGLPVTLGPAGFTGSLGNTIYSSSGFASGQVAAVTLPVNALVIGTPPIAVGTSVTGAIWAQYVTAGAPTTQQYAQIATINIKAT
jgi:hypothetical protein